MSYRLILAMGFMVLIGALTQGASSQSVGSQAKCLEPERRQFDFWIGEWDVSWGENQRGTNSVRATLDGCVIMESFDGRPAITLQGVSVSSFNQQNSKWQQTWVDNNGSYLDFVGGWQKDKMVLERPAVVDGKSVLQRMVWYNIKPDSLEWNWERSEDSGKTWNVLWQITYRRKR